MRDISARELKGHNILAVERFRDNTRWMIEFSVLRTCSYGSPGDEMRLFLTEDGYQAALLSQKRREIKIKRYAHVVEGHIIDFKPKKNRHPETTPYQERTELCVPLKTSRKRSGNTANLSRTWKASRSTG